MTNRRSVWLMSVFLLSMAWIAPALAEGAGGSWFDKVWAGGGLPIQLVAAFIGGLFLNLTPCIYPVIPITISFFLSQKKTSSTQTWMLSAAYVLGMSITYSSLGVVAALSGQLFGAAMQSPYVIVLIVVVMLALASSMFGLWEFGVPRWAGPYMGGRSGIGGAVIMGLVVGVVAAPCIGPFVLGLLTYVSQKQSVALGFLLFFTLSLGLGLPFLFLGVFSGVIEKLPRSGMWMVEIKKFFGVILVAMAGYFARPLLPHTTGQWLWAWLLTAAGAYLLLVARPGHNEPWLDRFMRLASAGLIVAGVLAMPASQPPTAAKLTWVPLEETALKTALEAGKPIMIDFFADWCGPCKKLEVKTFTDTRVASRMAEMVLFKADLTQWDDSTEALRQKFEVVGVPTLVFFNQGSEVDEARSTGFEDPNAFLKRLDLVLK